MNYQSKFKVEIEEYRKVVVENVNATAARVAFQLKGTGKEYLFAEEMQEIVTLCNSLDMKIHSGDPADICYWLDVDYTHLTNSVASICQMLADRVSNPEALEEVLLSLRRIKNAYFRLLECWGTAEMTHRLEHEREQRPLEEDARRLDEEIHADLENLELEVRKSVRTLNAELRVDAKLSLRPLQVAVFYGSQCLTELRVPFRVDISGLSVNGILDRLGVIGYQFKLRTIVNQLDRAQMFWDRKSPNRLVSSKLGWRKRNYIQRKCSRILALKTSDSERRNPFAFHTRETRRHHYRRVVDSDDEEKTLGWSLFRSTERPTLARLFDPTQGERPPSKNGVDRN